MILFCQMPVGGSTTDPKALSRVTNAGAHLVGGGTPKTCSRRRSAGNAQ